MELVRQSVKSINSPSYDVLYRAHFNCMFGLYIGGLDVLEMSAEPGRFMLARLLSFFLSVRQSWVHCSVLFA